MADEAAPGGAARGVPAFEAYYKSGELWPAASLERRAAIFG